MVLSIGIFFKRLFNRSIIFLPKKERDNHPIKVIMNKEIIISIPGMSKGK